MYSIENQIKRQTGERSWRPREEEQEWIRHSNSTLSNLLLWTRCLRPPLSTLLKPWLKMAEHPCNNCSMPSLSLSLSLSLISIISMQHYWFCFLVYRGKRIYQRIEKYIYILIEQKYIWSKLISLLRIPNPSQNLGTI